METEARQEAEYCRRLLLSESCSIPESSKWRNLWRNNLNYLPKHGPCLTCLLGLSINQFSPCGNCKIRVSLMYLKVTRAKRRTSLSIFTLITWLVLAHALQWKKQAKVVINILTFRVAIMSFSKVIMPSRLFPVSSLGQFTSGVCHTVTYSYFWPLGPELIRNWINNQCKDYKFRDIDHLHYSLDNDCLPQADDAMHKLIEQKV